MIQTLAKNWWLLAFCGVLYAIISVMYLIIQGQDGPLTLHAWSGMGVLLGDLILAAGACTIAAGLWRSATGKCWLLVVNGLALGSLGLIITVLFRFRISLRTVALLFVVMAISIGILELLTTRTLRLGLAGAASIGFAVAFVALGLGWIKIEQGSHADFLWFASYFGFTAICLLLLALRLRADYTAAAASVTRDSFQRSI